MTDISPWCESWRVLSVSNSSDASSELEKISLAASQIYVAVELEKIHWVYETGHYHAIFNLPTLVCRIFALQNFRHVSEVVVLASPGDEHEYRLWPLKKIVNIEFVTRDMMGKLIEIWLSGHYLRDQWSGVKGKGVFEGLRMYSSCYYELMINLQVSMEFQKNRN